MPDRQFLNQLSKKLADDGKLIEAGWVAFRLHAMHPDAGRDQVREMRMAFMAGAQHLFSSMLTTMDPDHEPTESDMRRLDMIDKELEAFIDELRIRIKQSRTPQ